MSASGDGRGPESRPRHDDLACYLRVVAAAGGAGGLLEVRWRRRVGMGQRFVAVDRLRQAERMIGALATRTDVYVGVLLRDRPAGGRAAIDGGRVAFVELDAAAASERLARAPAPPSMLVASGTPGHLHAYWLLDERASGTRIEEANRKLCHRIGGDMASVDCARILRPAGTLNHKHAPPSPVRLLGCDEHRVYALPALVCGLEDPRPRPVAPARSERRRRRSGPPTDGDLLHAQLRQISTGDYVRLLTGREPNREGKVHCPFHEGDHTASLQCYPDGTFCCFGCRRGGTIFDFAAALWGMQTKGREFLELRARLGERFGLTAPAAPGPRPPHLRRGATIDRLEVQR